MENKKLKDYIHFYLHRDCLVIGEIKTHIIGICANGLVQVAHSKGPQDHWNCENIKLILKPMSSLTQDDYKEIIGKFLGSDKLLFSVINGFWAVCVDEDFDDELEMDDEEKIFQAEECDHTNVLSYETKGGTLGYGTGDDMRYYVEYNVYAEFNRLLILKGYDVFGLIKAGLAMDVKEFEKIEQSTL